MPGPSALAAGIAGQGSRPTALRPITRFCVVALSEIDRNLLERCLARKPKAWEDFVDRFKAWWCMSPITRPRPAAIRLTPEDREDLCARSLCSDRQGRFRRAAALSGSEPAWRRT